MPHSSRIKLLQQLIGDSEILLVSDIFHLKYLFDFTTLNPPETEALALITRHSCQLLIGTFSITKNIEGVDIVSGSLIKNLLDLANSFAMESDKNWLSLDSNSLTLSWYERLKSTPITLQISKVDPIDQLRMIKDQTEQTIISANFENTLSLIEDLLKTRLQVGVSEIQLSQIIQSQLKSLAFPTIVAFGEHTAKPHHQPTSRELTLNQPVLIDCGQKMHDYCSDCTRTVWFGDRVDSEFQKIKKAVDQAFDQAKDLVSHRQSQTNLLASQIDQSARAIISASGYDKQFIHTTGHSLGLEIHEPPSIGAQNHQPLLKGMTITIEPGIYLDGKFGYRKEDTVILK